MTKKAELETSVKGLGDIYKINAPFDESLQVLRAQGIKYPISARDLAFARIQKGENSSLCNDGSYIRKGVIYIPKKGRFLTPNSPIIESPKEATNAHRNGKEFYVTGEQAERALEKSVKVNYNIKGIPTNRFGDDAIILFCFGETAQDYGLFLKDAGINEMPLYLGSEDYVNKQDKPYANQLWLSGLDGRSCLGGNRDLGYDSRVRGVLKKASEAGSQRFSGYSPNQVKDALKIVLQKTGLTGLEKQIIKPIIRELKSKK